MHGAAAGNQEHVAHTPVRQFAGDVVGNFDHAWASSRAAAGERCQCAVLPDRFVQRNPLLQPEFLAGPRGIRHIAFGRYAFQRLFGDLHRLPGAECLYHPSGQLRDTDGFFGADIVDPARLPANQNRPEPDRQVGGVQIGAQRRAVAANLDRPPLHAIRNEIADRKVDFERQVRTRKREQPGDRTLQAALPRIHRAEEFRQALALGVNQPRIGCIGAAGIAFGNVREARRLRAVNQPRN